MNGIRIIPRKAYSKVYKETFHPTKFEILFYKADFENKLKKCISDFRKLDLQEIINHDKELLKDEAFVVSENDKEAISYGISVLGSKKLNLILDSLHFNAIRYLGNIVRYAMRYFSFFKKFYYIAGLEEDIKKFTDLEIQIKNIVESKAIVEYHNDYILAIEGQMQLIRDYGKILANIG